MNNEEITDLIHLIDQSTLKYFELENADVSVKMSKRETESSNEASKERLTETTDSATIQSGLSSQTERAAVPVQAAAQEEVETADIDEEEAHIIKAPIVGTTYLSSSPESSPFVKVGDQVSKGQTLLIIEAMKVMNEIKSDVDGIIKDILVEDGQAVEFDQELIKIKAD